MGQAWAGREPPSTVEVTCMRVGVVVIGRNEERHLASSLRAVLAQQHERVVYADSASLDGSRDIARTLGVPVMALDDSEPRSASRGRNAGRAYLAQHHPEVDCIQFVDGDTELEPGWIAHAAALLDEHPDVGAVAGRLREKARERNVYHRLADMEFDTPAGDVDAVGGIAMYRAAAFDAAGGFDPFVVTGEERELCIRIITHGYRIVRVSDTMAYHDIDMDQFRQWWIRTVRSGQTYAEHWLDRQLMGRRVASIAFWGGALPAAALGLALPTLGLSLGLLTPYVVLWSRVRRDRLQHGWSADDASFYASAMVLSKLPEMVGVVRVVRGRLGAQ
jgi:GT2 family glycosyltransferase